MDDHGQSNAKYKNTVYSKSILAQKLYLYFIKDLKK